MSHTPTSKIELRLGCLNLPNLDWLSKTDCMVYCFQLRTFKDSQLSATQLSFQYLLKNATLIGKTEQIKDNLNPVFSVPILIDYYFEEEQNLRFVLVDVDSAKAAEQGGSFDFIGACGCTLASLLTAKDQKLSLDVLHPTRKFTKKVVLNIAAEELAVSNHLFKFRLQVKVPGKSFFRKPDPFIKVFREREDGSLVAVYTSTYRKNTTECEFADTVKQQDFCNSDKARILTWKVFDWEPSGSHKYIAEFSASINEIKSSDISRFNLVKFNYGALSPEMTNAKRDSKKENVGTASFLVREEIERFSFVDFLKAGTQLNVSFAIDFTLSNGAPSQPTSLHFIRNDGNLNSYEQAILAVGNIIQEYDTDRVFPAFGFGAKLPDGQVSHCWPINGKPDDPGCHGVGEVMDSYRLALRNIQLHGPTNFSPIINATCDEVDKFMRAKLSNQTNSPWVYSVLLIVTDGAVTDYASTVRAVIRASELPLSIIIIGVGHEASFDNMHALDSDDAVLADESGNRAKRDIVQFVALRDLKSHPNDHYGFQKELAAAVLHELPFQVSDWFSQRHIRPGY